MSNKLRADSVLHSLRGRKRAKRDRPFRRSEKSNKKDGERTTGGKKQVGGIFFALWGLVWFRFLKTAQ